MIKRIIRLPLYFLSLVTILILAFVFICWFPKAEGFLMLNTYHSWFLDLVFKILTNLGDGILSITCGLLLIICKKKKKATTLLLAYSVSGALAQLTKRIFDLPRPRLVLEQLQIHYPNFVDGVTLHDHHSFPSGHTSSAFAMATILVLIFKKNKISFPCFCLAVLVGYSRIYLAQHFLEDVFFGALLGILCALVSYYQVYDLKLFRSLKAAKRLKKLKVSIHNPG